MVRDLDMDIDIVEMPIIREADGLAMSSRNAYLSLQERVEALVLSQALALARALFASGQRSAGTLVQAMTGVVRQAPSARIDYLTIVDCETLEAIEKIDRPAQAALAVFIGKTRLIDNCRLEQ